MYIMLFEINFHNVKQIEEINTALKKTNTGNIL
jgi:hypothetical protein